MHMNLKKKILHSNEKWSVSKKVSSFYRSPWFVYRALIGELYDHSYLHLRDPASDPWHGIIIGIEFDEGRMPAKYVDQVLPDVWTLFREQIS